MTNEKARKVLDDVRAYLARVSSFENEMLAGHTFTDICIAIETLEQQPCEDCFTDDEKRIFLASVAREMRVCEVIDSEKTKVKLVPILERVKNKVLRSSLWEVKENENIDS